MLPPQGSGKAVNISLAGAGRRGLGQNSWFLNYCDPIVRPVGGANVLATDYVHNEEDSAGLAARSTVRAMSVSLESLMREAPDVGLRPSLGAELLSFILVGGTAALAFAGLSTLLIGAGTGVPDWILSAVCYALFIVPVYLAHRALSFRSKTPHEVALPRYVAVQLSALLLATLFSYVCYVVFGMPATIASFLVIGLTSGVNFIVLKVWAFAHRS